MSANWKRPFFTIYAGQAFSIIGSAAAQFSIIWWLTEKTGSGVVLTIATIFGFLPNILLGAFAGVFIDRYNRRTVMMLADGVTALSSALLALAFWALESPPMWMVYAALFARGLGSVFHGPAMQAAIPMLVPEEMLIRAGGWGNLVVSGGTLLGPVLGAFLMSVLPIAPIMLMDVVGAAFAIGSLLFVTIPDVPRSGERLHVLEDLGQGLRTISRNKPLVAVAIPMILTALAYMPLGALYPLLVRSHFLGTAWHNGVVEFSFSAGMMASSLAMGLWGGSRRRFLMISLSIAVLGLTSVISGVLPPSAFALFVLICFPMGATGTFLFVPLNAHIQSTVPPDQMGKVFSLLTTAMTLTTPLGLMAAGPLSDLIGVDRWFAYSGALLMAVALYCYLATRKYDAPPPDLA
jgi:DHA3 family macrolide efflux protein-like MFS transporter